MSWYRQWRNTWRQDRLQRDLDRELAFHVAERIDELEAGGMTPAEARRRAREQFGNHTIQVERTRDMDVHQWLDSAARNIRFAARSLRKTPVFTATVVFTLALGIGANSAVFSAIDAVLLRPLPFPDGDRLVGLAQSQPRRSEPFVAPVRLEDWNRLNTTFTAISGYYTQDSSELSGDLPEKLTTALVAPRFLQVWGVAPEAGRYFVPEEEKNGGAPAVIISDRLWRRRFAADPNLNGKVLRFGRSSVPVVGVMPAALRFPDREVDVWMSSPPDSPYAQSRENTWFRAVGRLRPGVTIEQARADLSTVQSALGRQFPKTDAPIKPVIEPLKESAIGGVRESLWILFGSVTLLLLIACTNIAAMLLSRAIGRQHEIAVRFSLGASRGTVAAQLLTEVLLLALAGAAAGLFLAALASRVFRLLARDLPRIEEIGLDGRIVIYSLVSAVAATLVCGLAPALRGTRRPLTLSLARAGRWQVGGRNRLQFLLVGVQVAFAVMLLAGAGLFLRSFQELGRVSPGFDPSHVLTFRVSSSWSETMDAKASFQRMQRILDGVAGLPGVDSAASTYSLPGVPTAFQIEMKTLEGRSETEPKMLTEGRTVSSSYFAAMRIPLLAGEWCRSDPQGSSMMVNRSFADSYLGGSRGIGMHLVPASSQYANAAVVSGIVGDARETGLNRPPVPTVYWCPGSTQPGSYFLVRTHGKPESMAETVRRKVHELEPRRSVYGLTPLTDHIADSFAENRMRTILLSFFAITAILLACVGLYGTLSYMVAIRQREVGLRLALGALRSEIARSFLAQGLKVAVVGCAVGLAMGLAVLRLLSGMLFGVKAMDGETLAAVSAVVLLVAVTASLLPALRAARLDPMRVLREE